MEVDVDASGNLSLTECDRDKLWVPKERAEARFGSESRREGILYSGGSGMESRTLRYSKLGSGETTERCHEFKHDLSICLGKMVTHHHSWPTTFALQRGRDTNPVEPPF